MEQKMDENHLTRRKFLLITAAGLYIALLDSCGESTKPVSKSVPSHQLSSGLPQTLSESIIPAGLGINIHFNRPNKSDTDMITAAGFGFIRMDFPWSDIERQKGEYNFSSQENLIQTFADRGVRALAILAYGNPLYDHSSAPFHVGPQTDEVRQAFARFAATAAAKFKRYNVIWEIWNEPNNPDFWQPNPDPASYVRLAKGAIEAIRQADPNAVIIAPAVIISFPQRNFEAWNFLERCFVLGLLEEKIDAISIHPYRIQPSEPPETVVADYQRLHDLMVRYMPQGEKILPIISSEWGYPVTTGVSKDLQAAFLVRQFLINIMKGVPLTVWYDWQDDGQDQRVLVDNFGILTWSHQQKPAYIGVQTLIRELSSFRYVKRLSLKSDKDFGIFFTNNSTNKIVLWTIGRPHSIQLEAGTSSATIVSLMGEQQPITSSNHVLTMELTETPQYLITKT